MKNNKKKTNPNKVAHVIQTIAKILFFPILIVLSIFPLMLKIMPSRHKND